MFVTQDMADPESGETKEVELGVMSIGFMLSEEDDAVIWRGPRKNGLIKQFLTDVDWYVCRCGYDLLAPLRTTCTALNHNL